MSEQNMKLNWVQARQSQRSQLLNTLLGTATVAGFFVILQSLLRVILNPQLWVNELQFIIPYTLVIVVFFWKRLDYRIRLMLPVLGIYGVGTVILLRDGVVGHGVWYLFIAPLLVFPLAGWVSGIVSLFLSVVIYSGVALAQLLGWIDTLSLPDPRIPYQFFNDSMTYGMMLILIGIGQGLFNRNQNRTLKSAFALNENLSVEQHQLQVQHEDLHRTIELLQLQAHIVTVSTQVLRDLIGMDDVMTMLRTGIRSFYERLSSSGLLCISLYVSSEDTVRTLEPRRSIHLEALPVTFIANAGDINASDSLVAAIPEVVFSALRSGVVAFNDLTDQKTGKVVSREVALPTPIQQRIQDAMVRRIYVLYFRFGEAEKFTDVDPIVWDMVGEHLAIAIQQTSTIQEAHRETYEVLDRIERQAQEFWRDGFAQGTVFSTRTAPDSALSDSALSDSIAQSQQQEVLLSDHGSQNNKANLVVPIRIRDEVLGVVDIQGTGTDHVWSEEELILVEVVVEQLGLALDSARLYEDSQRRSYREAVTFEITERIRSTLDVNTILEIAVREIGEVMGLDDLTIEFHDVPTRAIESSQSCDG